MAVLPKMVFAFKRKVRAQLKSSANHLQSLIDYDGNHLAVQPNLFTPDELIQVNAVRATLLAKLAVKKQK